MGTLNDIKKGLVIAINDEPYLVLEARFLRMQQRKPVMQTKMKNLITGKVLENNFKPGDRIAEADIAKKKVNYLYKDIRGYYFMDNESYEQFAVTAEIIGGQSQFLKEGLTVDAVYFNSQPISIQLPPKVELKVTSAPPGSRGDTAQGKATKPIILETGVTINAPLFIKESDIIRINTETGEYVERVN
ncbi:MAG: elongation factor P [bacterium]